MKGKKNRNSCGCFGPKADYIHTPLDSEKSSLRGHYMQDCKDISDSASFYSLDPDEPTVFIPGLEADLQNTFNMGSTIPHSHSPSVSMGWSHSKCDHFKVRKGPDYKRHGHKAPSLDFLYDAVGADLLKSDCILSNIAPHLLFPAAPDYYDPRCGFPALLVVNTQLPLTMPSLFSSSEDDPGVSVVGYYMIKRETVQWGLGEGSTQPPAAVNVFRKLLEKKHSEKALAFKAIGLVHEIEKQNLPLMSLLTKYNGKPVLVTASSSFHFGSVPYPYLEIDYNVRKWSLLARTTLVQLNDKLKGIVCHVGYLVEATENEDQPERMLAATTIHNLDLSQAKFIKFSK